MSENVSFTVIFIQSDNREVAEIAYFVINEQSEINQTFYVVKIDQQSIDYIHLNDICFRNDENLNLLTNRGAFENYYKYTL